MFSKILFICLTVQVLCNPPPWIGIPDAHIGLENWFNHHNALVNQTEMHKADIELVFFGDSITFGWLNYGKDIWNQYYTKPRHAYNYGIGGDRTESVIYRIENKEFDGIKPKAVVLMIGTNNLNRNPAVDIAIGIYEIKRQLEAKLPTANILILGILPREGEIDVQVKEINKIISSFADNKRVFYLDMGAHFQTGPGKIVADLFQKDTVHPSTNGYKMWHQVMEPTLKFVLNETSSL